MRRTWSQHSGVLSTAGSLFGTTVVTSGLGFVYWWTATQMLPPTAVGYGSAAVNVMTFIGTVGMLGLGTMLIGELRGGSTPQPGLVAASLVVTGVASSVIGVATLVVMHVAGIRSLDVNSYLVDVLFVVGAGLTGVAFVLDLALVGSGAGTLQLGRNAVFAAAKWVLLFALIPALPPHNGLGILAAWVAGLAISFALFAVPSTRRRLPRMSSRPDWAALRSVRGATSAHNAFNLAGQIPRLLLPVIATSLISPAAGATFFLAWMIAGFFYIAPTHLSTALFAIGAGQSTELGEKLRFSFRLSLLLGALGGPLLAALAPELLQLFGSSYSTDGAASLRILCIAYLPMIFKTHYVAVVRVQRKLAKGSLVAILGAALELIGASIGALTHGVSGLAVGVLAGLTIEAAIMAPTLVRAGLLRAIPPPSQDVQSAPGHVRRAPGTLGLPED